MIDRQRYRERECQQAKQHGGSQCENGGRDRDRNQDQDSERIVDAAGQEKQDAKLYLIEGQIQRRALLAQALRRRIDNE